MTKTCEIACFWWSNAVGAALREAVFLHSRSQNQMKLGAPAEGWAAGLGFSNRLLLGAWGARVCGGAADGGAGATDGGAGAAGRLADISGVA